MPAPLLTKSGMGRSRVGGTRSMVRGAVGDVVYQVAKDSAGDLQQRVYARSRERVNNNTPAQAKARMIMGQIQRMFHFLPEIITGAFDTIPRGAQSFWHFAKVNYPLLKQDFEKWYQFWGEFAWRYKYEMDAPVGPWVLTTGGLPSVNPDYAEILMNNERRFLFGFDVGTRNATYGELLKTMKFQKGDSLYIVMFWAEGYEWKPTVDVSQFYFSRDYADDTLLAESDVNQIIQYRGQFNGFCTYPDTGYNFAFEINTGEGEPPRVFGSYAFIHYRPTDSYPLFSSAQFAKMLPEFYNIFQPHYIYQVYQQWCDTVQTNNNQNK